MFGLLTDLLPETSVVIWREGVTEYLRGRGREGERGRGGRNTCNYVAETVYQKVQLQVV